MRCPLNYYMKPMLVELNGNCIACSNLCQYCEVRNQDEISSLQSNFELEELNLKFTTRCLKPVKDPNIVINTSFRNAKYCFNKSCQNWSSFPQYLTEFLLDRQKQYSQEEEINFQYCNLVGVDQMMINYIFSFHEYIISSDSLALKFSNGLQKKIFSLKKTNMKLFCSQRLLSGKSQQQIDLILNKLNFITTKFLDCHFSKLKYLETLQFRMFTFQILPLLIQLFLIFTTQPVLITFNIKNLTFKNCLIENSTLFNIDHIQDIIKLEDILIENFTLLNSAFFTFSTDLSHISKIKLTNIEITQCSFDQSFFLQSKRKFEIIADDLQFRNNYLQNSVNINRVKTLLFNIRFYLYYCQRLVRTIDDFEDDSSTFQDSNLIVVYSSLQINKFIVNIKNIKVQENTLADKVKFLIFQNLFLIKNCFFRFLSMQVLVLSLGNIILKNRVATSLSLLNKYYFQFIQNIVNQYIDEPLDTQSNLLHISSLDSFLQIQPLYFYQNALTNSTQSNLYTSCNYDRNFKSKFHRNQCFIIKLMWMNIVSKRLTQLFNQHFKLSNLQSQLHPLVVQIVIFKKLLLLKVLFFRLQLKDKEQQKQLTSRQILYILIQQILETQVVQVQIHKQPFVYQSKRNQIKKNIQQNGYTIIHDYKENFILLNNIEIKNFLSLMNKIMLAKFFQQKQGNKVKQILIIQQFIKVKKCELENNLSQENAMIFLENCKVDIQNINGEGIIISPIFQFYNAFTLKIFDFKLVLIQKLYSFDLVLITQNIKAESKISIEKPKILQSITYKEKSDRIPIFSNLNYNILGCSEWRSTSITDQTIYPNILSQIQSFTNQSNQLIYIKSTSNQNSLRLSQIEIMSNDGSDFSNGMITFEAEHFKIFKIDNIF
ncbi:unnamed protein product [Paramecium octaurelia]|uniref:Uncharacterized protein n=1 Tax=Paramecium octaurelia TaxID=43137 RepID=A0A8S1TYT4_PAROT|nr:unnamed protein product [Paramecium octaurelia]